MFINLLVDFINWGSDQSLKAILITLIKKCITGQFKIALSTGDTRYMYMYHLKFYW